MFRSRAIAIVMIVSLFITLVPFIQAQTQPCPSFVAEALQAIGDNCADMSRNSACYGYNRVNTTFTEPQPAAFFTLPSERAELEIIQAIETTPLDIEQSEWGIAVLNVQADLPTALPGQGVVLMLIGGVRLESTVATSDTQELVQIEVTTTVGLNMRTRPTELGSLVASIPEDTTLLADQRTEAGDWLRVVYEDNYGWVSAEFVESDADFTRLPTLDNIPPSPMQAFTLETSITGVECTEAPPSMMVVQAPRNGRVQLTVNGLQMSVGSTVVLTSNRDEGLQIGVLDGSVETDDGVVVPEGFTTSYEIDTSSGEAIGEPAAVRPLSESELQQLAPIQEVPGAVLDYTVELPSGTEVFAVVGTPTPLGTPTPTASATSTETLTPTHTPTPTATATPTPAPLVITTTCVALATDARTFLITNPNAYELTFSWFSAEGGTGISSVPAFQTYTLSFVPTVPTPDILLLVDYTFGQVFATSSVCPA